VDCESHGAGQESDFGIRMGAGVVEKLIYVLESGSSGFALCSARLPTVNSKVMLTARE
jgi:hypothetical protein